MAAPLSGVTVRVISNRLPQLPAAVHHAAQAEVKTAGLQIEAGAKAKAPVLTGTLRRSIHTVMSNDDLTATVGPSVEYGLYVEFGSRGRPPKPFMRPAAAAVIPRFVERMKAVLKGLP